VVEPRPELVVLLVGLVVSAITDATRGKILNLVTFPMMALGVVIHLTSGSDPWLGLVGLGAAALLHVPLWLGGIHKAGDVKLLMGIGACVGWREMLEATVWLAVLYVPIGLVVLALRGRLAQIAHAARYQLNRWAGQPSGPAPQSTWIRTGPIIALAALIGWLTDLAALR
jgi:Flp pilus assembly protein protease CpaA